MTEERQEATELKEKRLQEMMASDKTIRNLIFVVREQQVIMDSDLATLYQVETKVFNQVIKRNIAHFPDAFL